VRTAAGRPTVEYAHGYSRHLWKRGQVLVRGRWAKIAGIVCMDRTMVDVIEVPGVKDKVKVEVEV